MFDFVFHYAAVVGVQRTLNNPALVLEDIQGIKNILDLCRRTGVKRVFYSSSSEVYGEPVEFPQNEETTPLNSRLPYAVVKNVGESFLRSYHKEYSLNYTIFRFFNVAGSDGEHMQVGDATHLIRIAAEVATGKREKMYIFGNDYDTKDGTCVRDYIHVVDLANAIANAIEKGPFNTPYECIGSGKGYSVLEVLNTMKTMYDIKYEIADRREGDPAFLAIDNQFPLLDIKHELIDMCKSAVEVERKRK